MELSKLRAVKVGGKWRLTEVSKKQRMILEKMEISVPVEANMVIKKGGVQDWYVNGYWKYAIMFERIAGWLLMALFIVVLTKKLIRQQEWRKSSKKTSLQKRPRLIEASPP